MGGACTVRAVTATTDDVVCLAAQWIHEGRRVDLRALAAELGVSRTTLHRRVGNREALLGRALWTLAEEAMRRVDAELDAQTHADPDPDLAPGAGAGAGDGDGDSHVDAPVDPGLGSGTSRAGGTDGGGRTPSHGHAAAAVTAFNRAVATHPGLRRFLDDEPLTAVRLLTDSRGFIQPRIVAAVEDVLRRDLDGHDDPPFARADQLAYALVRLSESFLYADVIADRQPDVETVNRLAVALIESWLASVPSG